MSTASSRSVSYVSPNQQSMTVAVYQNGQLIASVTQNLTATSPNCMTTSTGTTCSIPLNLQPGSYRANVDSYASPGGHGVVLSIQYNVPFTVPSGGNGNPAVIPWTLYGVPESLVVAPVASSLIRSMGTNVTTLYGSTVDYTAQALDATGATIVGAGSPTWTVTSSNANFTVAPPTAQHPALTITASGTAAATTQLTFQANFPPDETAAISSACRQPKAVCTTSATLNRLDVADDDWVTYQRDYQRSGNEPQTTGLTTATAPKLALRWKVKVPNGSITASPVVWGGHVIVTGFNVIYDYSAIDGSLLWSRTVAYPAAKTPTVDPEAG